MKTKTFKNGIVGVGLFVLGFVIASFVLGFINEDRVEENDNSTSIIVAEHNSLVGWLNEIGIVGEREKVELEDQVQYRVNIFLPLQKKILKMPISKVEYQILQEKDQVKIHYVFQGEELLFVQFIRDDQGRLQIVDNRPVVVLDAGHGGFDNGEGSNDFGLEKQFNLAITLKQRELLENSGIRVILTRSTDEFVSLYDRCEISNYVDADVFISNHINKYNGETSGIEVFYNLAGDENLAQNLADGLSQQGIGVHKVETKTDDRFPLLDYYFVHEYNKCSSYIVEYGFADFEKDATLINQKWENMAASVCETLKAYFLEEK